MKDPKTLPTRWRMRDKRYIAIVDMEDGHLTNTILMIRRNFPKHLERASNDKFARELSSLAGFHSTLNGDMAQMSVEQEMSSLRPEEYNTERALARYPVFVALVREAEFRSDLREFETRGQR